MNAFVREIGQAEFFDHAYQCGKRFCIHLLQNAAAMNLDGDLRNAKFGGNLLVEHAFDEQDYHLPFA
ncbi:hypothetical protein D3C80_2226100 [compost metagenome]